MLTIFQIALVVRQLIGVTANVYVAPKTLAIALGLEPVGDARVRAGVVGLVLYFDDTLPPAEQDYQIARAACAYALRILGLIREVSPHDLAVELCRVYQCKHFSIAHECSHVRV